MTPIEQEGAGPGRGPRARFLIVAEVAEQLRVSTMTVYRLIKSGELPAVRIGRSFRLREDDVDVFLSRRFTEAG
ncbi:MAG: helix-turn-helix domain-containing protein [Acidimicrobiales bacterium]